MRDSPIATPISIARRQAVLGLTGLQLAFVTGVSTAAEDSSPPTSGASAARQSFEVDSPLGLNADGKNLVIGDLPGRVLIVCFWAAWCPHCRAEIPVLERIQAKVSVESLRVVLVNTEPVTNWRRVRRELDGKIKSLMTHDSDGGVRKAFTAPEGVPHTVLVGRTGRRQATLNGWSNDSVEWLLEHTNKALAEPRA